MAAEILKYGYIADFLIGISMLVRNGWLRLVAAGCVFRRLHHDGGENEEEG